jgi:hypothetical protein
MGSPIQQVANTLGWTFKCEARHFVEDCERLMSFSGLDIDMAESGGVACHICLTKASCLYPQKEKVPKQGAIERGQMSGRGAR